MKENREIKFRVWSTYKSDMPGKMIRLGYDTIGMLSDLKDDKHWKVMQFTGLKDKNGKEIYEGDIVVCSFEQSTPEVVEYGGWSSNAVHDVYGYVFNASAENDTLIVIGNIHENPELLEGK